MYARKLGGHLKRKRKRKALRSFFLAFYFLYNPSIKERFSLGDL